MTVPVGVCYNIRTKAADSSNNKLGSHSFLFRWSCVLTVCLCGMERRGLNLEEDSIVVLGWNVSNSRIISLSIYSLLRLSVNGVLGSNCAKLVNQVSFLFKFSNSCFPLLKTVRPCNGNQNSQYKCDLAWITPWQLLLSSPFAMSPVSDRYSSGGGT